MNHKEEDNKRKLLVEQAHSLAPLNGYNQTRLANVRILRTQSMLYDVPVLYKPGAVFVLQGRKQGVLNGEIYRYDEDHYLAVSVPVSFRMQSTASRERPLFAVYVDFDMQMAADIVLQVESHAGQQPHPGKGLGVDELRGLISSRMDAGIEEVIQRLLCSLRNPVESAILGESLLRELHYRVLMGPQGGAMIAALKRTGRFGKVVQSIVWLRENFGREIAVSDLARDVGMSVPSYHVHFKGLTGSSPMQYIKAMRLHEARLMIARSSKTIAEVATLVGYASPAQFSRDFKRHFSRTATEEAKWVRHHLGEVV